ncbi:MAG: hypothetical protein M1825_006502 [Sarcosagium campestre]|nr:MAG: hypothetical protein M1825_006502 [Sarcosagium campestre]
MGSNAIVKLDVKRTEVTEVYCPENPLVDIVFVHGLNGHPKNTWTKNDVFWPAQLLPKTLNRVEARVLTYGYNADVYAFGGNSATGDYIHEHAQTLVTTLDAERYNEDASQRPIIFVAHSLGGILVKRALELSAAITNINTQNLRSIYTSTYGIIFLGTPHNGADPAKWGRMLQSMASALLPRKMLDTEPQLVNTLRTQSETLQNINIGFANIMDKFHMYFFHEALKTNLGLTQDYIVDQTSAGPIYAGPAYAGIEATHSEMCKFDSKDSPGYTAVSSTLKRWTQEAQRPIEARWAQEFDIRQRNNEYLASHLLGRGTLAENLAPPKTQSGNVSRGPSTGTHNSPGRLQALPAPGSEPRYSDYTVEEVEDGDAKDVVMSERSR